MVIDLITKARNRKMHHDYKLDQRLDRLKLKLMTNQTSIDNLQFSFFSYYYFYSGLFDDTMNCN